MADGALQKPHRWVFTLTILVGSFLLFMVQPMVARMALPRLGGAPNVWNSAMVVYQALLLAGYCYAHLLTRFSISRQAIVHLALLLLAGLTLPLSLKLADFSSPGWEVVWVPLLFLATVGPVFFVVSAQAPLMQSWFAAHPEGQNPYPLYAASNLGSFGGLIAYPLLLEPLLPLGAQSRWWMVGYSALILLVALSAFSRRGVTAPAAHMAIGKEEEGGDRRTTAMWLALSAVPSGLMLSTTSFLTTDIMAMPLLWVIPLGLYLLSFSVAFAESRVLARAISLAAPILVPVFAALSFLLRTESGILAGLSAAALLFVGAVALHARLYDLRPAPRSLTRFYLFMSLGGVLGGAFTALVAPVVFDWTWEHPILILLLVMLLPLDAWRRLLDGLVIRLVVARTLVLSAALAAMTFSGLDQQLLLSMHGERTRSYFGIYTVTEREDGSRWLLHGTTTHGVQLGDSTEPTAYYSRDSGAGRVLLDSATLFGENARIGAVGLGTGTLACYRLPGQDWTFFEIDPAVLAYSTNDTFTFMSQCTPDADTVIGDARLELDTLPTGHFDILVIDAFSSDSIPLHLLTREALSIYRRTLDEDGLLLFHISNKFIDLEPVIAALARDAKLNALIRSNEADEATSAFASQWVVLGTDQGKLEALKQAGGWSGLDASDAELWTDDYASVLPHLKGDFFQ